MIISAYIDFFRGTPVFFQLYFFYFGLPGLIPGFPTNKWACAVIVFGLNSGAYLAEVMRAGIEGIDKGQIEACQGIGRFTKGYHQGYHSESGDSLCFTGIVQ